MFFIVTYDVCTTDNNGKKRLRNVSKICCNFGIRVQNSVFECNMDASLFVQFKNSLLSIIDEEHDSLRIYNLGDNYHRRIDTYGCKSTFDMEDELIL